MKTNEKKFFEEMYFTANFARRLVSLNCCHDGANNDDVADMIARANERLGMIGEYDKNSTCAVYHFLEKAVNRLGIFTEAEKKKIEDESEDLADREFVWHIAEKPERAKMEANPELWEAKINKMRYGHSRGKLGWRKYGAKELTYPEDN